jgi:UPF0271 protein
VGPKVPLLNIDLGELPDEPEGLYACAHLAHIACGGHAGDDASMLRAAQRCRDHGTRVGAHPSYPDRDGFGRRAMTIAPGPLRTSIAEQCGRLATIARVLGVPVAFVKPHGALYHAARDQAPVAEAVVAGGVDALGSRVTVVGPPHGELAKAAARRRLAYAREGFADRAARPDGTLVARDQAGALVLDPAVAAERAREFAVQGGIDTICVHGDTPGAVSIARAVREALDAVAGG